MCDLCGNPYVSRKLVIDFDDQSVKTISLVQEFEDNKILARTGTLTEAESDAWTKALEGVKLPVSVMKGKTLEFTNDDIDNAPVTLVDKPSDENRQAQLDAIEGIRQFLLDTTPGSRQEKVYQAFMLEEGMRFREVTSALRAGETAEFILDHPEQFSYTDAEMDTSDKRVELLRPLLEELGLDTDTMVDAVRSGVPEDEFVTMGKAGAFGEPLR